MQFFFSYVCTFVTKIVSSFDYAKYANGKCLRGSSLGRPSFNSAMIVADNNDLSVHKYNRVTDSSVGFMRTSLGQIFGIQYPCIPVGNRIEVGNYLAYGILGLRAGNVSGNRGCKLNLSINKRSITYKKNARLYQMYTCFFNCKACDIQLRVC